MERPKGAILGGDILTAVSEFNYSLEMSLFNAANIAFSGGQPHAVEVRNKHCTEPENNTVL